MASFDSIPLFSTLSPQARQFLASMTQERILEPEQVLFHEGEEANAFYVVVSGSLSVFHPCGDTICKIVNMVRPGEPVGEMALFSEQKERRNASVKAEEKSVVIVFPDFTISMLREKEPAILESLQQIIQTRREMNTEKRDV